MNILRNTVYVVVLVAGLLFINDRVKTYDFLGHTVTVIK